MHDEAHPHETAPTHGVSSGEGASIPLTTKLLHVFALQDLLLMAYLVTMLVLLGTSPPHEFRMESLRATGLTLLFLVASVTAARTANPIPRWFTSNLYRVTVAGTVIVNYIHLKHLLPVVRQDILDDALARIDLAVLGQHPAIVLEPYSTKWVVEFLAFFYFGYFFMCVGFVVGSLWLAPRNHRTTEYAIGTALVYGIGQLGYTIVPGVGPIHYLKDAFQAPLEGGFFWQLVLDTVNASGAHKDVFPSLHTAAPVWYSLHALRRARFEPAWKWPSRITAFSAACIVVSTIVLRWHYVVDVVAGLTLASFVFWASIRFADWSEALRARIGAPALWDLDREPAQAAVTVAPTGTS
jgi:membrane-associated phospholipid phosphatase